MQFGTREVSDDVGHVGGLLLSAHPESRFPHSPVDFQTPTRFRGSQAALDPPEANLDGFLTWAAERPGPPVVRVS